MNKTLTFGQKAVGLSFNPSNDSLVDHFKVKLADLIDEANAVRETSDDPEVKRMASIAITELQTAQMWIVKAVTWKN
ncbi:MULTISPECIES: Acb2/Tad1 domain-containing protein [Providencia]|uniref:Acb2/Tad1 domain-containing protein n=1 Tax=Providencia TaxID=586 RepID=UPI0022742364|nr:MULTISPECIES: hypothetical protein [unclassified Providencia]MDB9567837.1 hypothetical protein [Providencia rettgeri]WOC02457.1 hypothetical protein P3L56_11450 [Providencia sp. PROV024]